MFFLENFQNLEKMGSLFWKLILFLAVLILVSLDINCVSLVELFEENQESFLSYLAKNCQDNKYWDIVKKNPRYISEEYNITTEDGYILKLFRIRHKKIVNSEQKASAVVFYKHGLNDSSDSFLFDGDGNTGGYYLLEKGVDLWLGNSRGNKYSGKSHINPEISDKEFYNYSWQEMARYDLPAFYKFIIEKTDIDQMYYIGYSMGSAEIMAAMSDHEVSDYIQNHTKKVIILGPVVYLKHIDNFNIQWLSKMWNNIEFKNFLIENDWLYNTPASCKFYEKIGYFLQKLCSNFETLCEKALGGANMSKEFDRIDKLPEFM